MNKTDEYMIIFKSKTIAHLVGTVTNPWKYV